jgi:hypothetical protein
MWTSPAISSGSICSRSSQSACLVLNPGPPLLFPSMTLFDTLYLGRLSLTYVYATAYGIAQICMEDSMAQAGPGKQYPLCVPTRELTCTEFVNDSTQDISDC